MPLVIEENRHRQSAYMKESPDFYYNKKDSSQVKDERSEKEKLLRLWEDDIKMKKLVKKQSTAQSFAHDRGGVQMAHSMTMAALRANLMVEGSYPEDLPVVVAVDATALERKTMSTTESLAEDSFRNYMDGMWSWLKEIIEDQSLPLEQKTDKIFREIEWSKDYTGDESSPEGVGEAIVAQGQGFPPNILEEYLSQFQGQQIIDELKKLWEGEIPSQLIQQGMGEFRSKTPIGQPQLVEVYLVQAIKPDASIEMHWHEGEDLTQEELDELGYHVDYDGNLADELGRKILGHDAVFYDQWVEPKSIWKNPQAGLTDETGVEISYFGTTLDAFEKAFPGLKIADPRMMAKDLPLLNEPNLRLGRKKGDRAWAIFRLNLGRGNDYVICGGMNGEIFVPYIFPTQETAEDQLKKGGEWAIYKYGGKVLPVVFNGTYWEKDVDVELSADLPLLNEPEMRLGQMEEEEHQWAVKAIASGLYMGVDPEEEDTYWTTSEIQNCGDPPSMFLFFTRFDAEELAAKLRLSHPVQGVDLGDRESFKVVPVKFNPQTDGWEEIGDKIKSDPPAGPDLPLLDEPDLRLGQRGKSFYAIKNGEGGEAAYVRRDSFSLVGDRLELADLQYSDELIGVCVIATPKAARSLLRILRDTPLLRRQNFKIISVGIKDGKFVEIFKDSPPASSDLPLLNEPDMRLGQTAPNTQFRNQDVQVDSGGPQPQNEERNPYGYEGRGPTSDRYFKEKGSGNTHDGQPLEQDLAAKLEAIWLRARTRVYLPKGIIPEDALLEVIKNVQTHEYVVKSISDSQGISKEDIRGLKFPPEMVESGKFFEIIPAEGSIVSPATDWPYTVNTEVKDSPDRELDQSFWGLNRFQREP